MFRENGLKLAVISAGVRDYVYMITEKVGLDAAAEINDVPSFDVVVAGDMVDFNKPNPLPYLACSETFAIHPSYCLVLEDSRLGVEAAYNAGMKVICVPGPYTERWRVSGADVVLYSLEDLNMPTLRSLWFEAGERFTPHPQLQPDLGFKARPRRF
jgi:beta-phosphoglucomutase-like phosphatase (HAD superfamily)